MKKQTKQTILKKEKKEKSSKGIVIGKTHLWAIGLMFLTTALTSTAQGLYKLGIPKLEFNIVSILSNWPILTGLFIYIIGAVVFILALKGGEVSVLYPIIATSYLWVSLISMIFFNEAMNIFKWFGVFAIIAGVCFIAFGSNHNSPEKNTKIQIKKRSLA